MFPAIWAAIQEMGSGLLSKIGTETGISSLVEAPNLMKMKNPLTAKIAEVAAPMKSATDWGKVGVALAGHIGGPTSIPGMPALPSFNIQQATPRYLQETQKKQPTIEQLIQMIARR